MKPRPNQEAEIIRLFYRTVLRPGEDVIDNRDSQIAKEIGVKIGLVHRILHREMIEKIKMAGKDSLSTDEKEIIKERTKEFEELEVEYTEVKPAIQYPITPKRKNKKGQYEKEPTLYFNP